MQKDQSNTAESVRSFVGIWSKAVAGYEWVEGAPHDRPGCYWDGQVQRIFWDRRGHQPMAGARPIYDRVKVEPVDAAGPFLCERQQQAPVRDSVYDPVSERTLCRDFLKIDVRTADDDTTKSGILEFAGKYGLLGFRQVTLDGVIDGQFGESLSSWRIEVYKFRVLWSLCRLLDDGRADSTARLTRIFEPPIGVDLEECVGFRLPLALREFYDPGDWLRPFGEPLGLPIREVATRYAIHMLNHQLDMHVAPVLDVRPGSPMFLVPRNLIGAIYLQFALKRNGGVPEARKCKNPECGNLIQDRRSNKEFCSRRCNDRFQYLSRRGAAGGSEQHE